LVTPRDPEKPDRNLAAIGLFIIGCYFFRLTRHALSTGFSSDDLMNLHRSWFFPLRALVKANLLFFLPSDFGRPMGSLCYRSIFYFAGFHGALFHAAGLTILLANIFLTYAVARRLSGSRLAALAAALLLSYERRWTPLYFDTGYIYDVLCYFFTFAALLWYIAIRQKNRVPRIAESAALLALFVCALNSKEMAIALPAVLALYELLYGLIDGPRRAVWLIAITGAMTVAFMAGRAGPMVSNAAYRPEIGLTRFLATTSHFLNEIFVLNDWFTPPLTLAFCGALLVVALAARLRPLIFAWAFTAITALPIAFVPPRNGPQYYIPFFGCALYAGCAISGIAATLRGAIQPPHLIVQLLRPIVQTLRRTVQTPRPVVQAPRPAIQPPRPTVQPPRPTVHPPRPTLQPPYWAERAAAACLLLAIAWPLYAYYKKLGMSDVASMSEDSPVWMSLAAQMRALRPALPPDARLLFLNDPMMPNIYDMDFLVRLTYRDRSLMVDRAKTMPQRPSPRQMQGYDAVFDYHSGKLTELPQRVAIHPAILEFFDADWKAIDANHPAHPGDHIIAKAADLGPTDPEASAGEAFPHDPFAESILRLNLRVNGRRAEVPQHLGSPGEVNIYRFDFRIPPQTEAGMAQVQLTVGGQSAPPAVIPVRH